MAKVEIDFGDYSIGHLPANLALVRHCPQAARHLVGTLQGLLGEALVIVVETPQAIDTLLETEAQHLPLQVLLNRYRQLTQ